mgnify:CR=1 FL=1
MNKTNIIEDHKCETKVNDQRVEIYPYKTEVTQPNGSVIVYDEYPNLDDAYKGHEQCVQFIRDIDIMKEGA